MMGSMGTLIRSRRALLLPLILTILVLVAHYNEQEVKEGGKQVEEYPNVFNRFRQNHLKVDRTLCTKADILRQVQEACPRLPIKFSYEMRDNKDLHYKNESCAPFPDASSLKINNVHWQILETSNGTFHLFGAYYDVRKRNPDRSSIRILVMINRVRPTVKTYCQVWFANRSEPIIAETKNYRLIWKWEMVNDGTVLYPHLITCPVVSPSAIVPIFVSLVERACDSASNSLRIFYNPINQSAEKDNFAVCVKNMDALHEDLSVRLVEWIELLKILGVQKVFFYDHNNHENNTKVLRYYEQRGDVEVTPITHAGYQSNVPDFHRLKWRAPNLYLQSQLNELVSFNDCFYKNMYKYDYIVLLDYDEVIMPLKEDNWTDLMSRIQKEALPKRNDTPIYFSAKNVLFDPNRDNSTVHYSDIPSYLYMLQHVQREAKHLNRGPKTFFDTELLETLHHHWPFSSLIGSLAGYEFAIEDAQLNHYRNELYLDFDKQSYNLSRVNDTAVWRYKSALTNRCLAVLYDLDFFG